MADELRLEREQLIKLVASVIYAAELHANMVNKATRRDPDIGICIDRARHIVSAPVTPAP
jgi:hypothetical protein